MNVQRLHDLVRKVANTPFGVALRELRGTSYGKNNLDIRLRLAIKVSDEANKLIANKKFATRKIRVIIAQSILSVCEPLTEQSDGYRIDETEKTRETNAILRETAWKMLERGSELNRYEASAFRLITGM